MSYSISSLYCSLPTGWYNYFWVVAFISIFGFALSQPTYRKALKDYFQFKNIFRLSEVEKSGQIFFALLAALLLTLIFERTSTACWN